jgi:hypothetical protein
MFIVVWAIFAIIGSAIALEVSFLSLVFGLIATPFTILFAVMIGIARVTGSGRLGKNSSDIDYVNDVASGPLVWAGAVTSSIWRRLGRILSRETATERPRNATDWPTSMFGQHVYNPKNAEDASLTIMVIVALLLDIVAVLILEL